MALEVAAVVFPALGLFCWPGGRPFLQVARNQLGNGQILALRRFVGGEQAKGQVPRLRGPG